MSEPKPSEQYHTSTDEIRDAMAMLGKGYQDSPLEIHPEARVIRRRGRELTEEVVPAFVKISTDFKEELAEIDEISLKVWLFIALSVNRITGKANPGLRTIAMGTGLAVNTIQAALKRLEDKYNLLIVDRESRKFNIYEPLAFVSANRSTPISAVSADDTATGTVSDDDKSVSDGDESVSARMTLNQRNQNKPENTRSPLSNENLEKANQKVDAILQQERVAQEKQASGAYWPGRDKMPEPIRRLLDVYVQVTGQRPLKGRLMDWLQTGQEWLEIAAQPDDIRAAYKVAKPDTGGGFNVSRPGSLTNTIGMIVGERRKQTNPETGSKVILAPPPQRKTESFAFDPNKPFFQQFPQEVKS